MLVFSCSLSMMEASRDGELVRLYHDGPNFRISQVNNTKYRVKRFLGKNDARILYCPSDYVSKTHCEVFREHNVYKVKDLSSNGTYLNGVRIMKDVEREIRFGDKLSFGISHLDGDPTINLRDSQWFIFEFKPYENIEVVDLSDDDEDITALSETQPVPTTSRARASSPSLLEGDANLLKHIQLPSTSAEEQVEQEDTHQGQAFAEEDRSRHSPSILDINPFFFINQVVELDEQDEDNVFREDTQKVDKRPKDDSSNTSSNHLASTREQRKCPPPPKLSSSSSTTAAPQIVQNKSRGEMFPTKISTSAAATPAKTAESSHNGKEYESPHRATKRTESSSDSSRNAQVPPPTKNHVVSNESKRKSTASSVDSGISSPPPPSARDEPPIMSYGEHRRRKLNENVDWRQSQAINNNTKNRDAGADSARSRRTEREAIPTQIITPRTRSQAKRPASPPALNSTSVPLEKASKSNDGQKSTRSLPPPSRSTRRRSPVKETIPQRQPEISKYSSHSSAPSNTQKPTQGRGTKFIDDAPLPRSAVRAQHKTASRETLSRATKQNHRLNEIISRSSIQQRDVDVPLSKDEINQLRKEKLKRVAQKGQEGKKDSQEPKRRPAGKIKITQRNRNQGLFEDVAGKDEMDTESIVGGPRRTKS